MSEREPHSKRTRVELAVRAYATWPLIVAAFAAAIYLINGLGNALPVAFSGTQKTIYTTLAGTSGTLLGFTLAAMTFLAAVPKEAPLLKRLHGEGLLDVVVIRFARLNIRAALLLGVSLIGLVVDREPTSALTAEKLGHGAYWCWPVTLIAAACAVGLVRAISILLKLLRSVLHAHRPA